MKDKLIKSHEIFCIPLQEKKKRITHQTVSSVFVLLEFRKILDKSNLAIPAEETSLSLPCNSQLAAPQLCTASTALLPLRKRGKTCLMLPSNILGCSCRFLRTHHSQREYGLLRTDSSKQGRQDLAHSKFSLEMVPTKSPSHGNRTFLATWSLGCLCLMFPSGDRLKARSLQASSQQTQRGCVAPWELLPGLRCKDIIFSFSGTALI